MKKILLPIDPSEYTKAAWKYVVEISKLQKAFVEGIAILDVLDIVEQAVTFFPLPQGTEGHIKKEEDLLVKARKKVEEELINFKEACKAENLRCQAKIMEGRPDFIIEKESLYNDLIVMGIRNFFHFETRNRPETSLKDILGYINTPVLAVPKTYKPIRKVLMTYDASAPSMKAIQRFVTMTKGMEYEIILLTKSDDEKAAMAEMEKLEDYLAHHGNRPVTKRWISHSLRKTVGKDYLDTVDMIICGKYSKSPVKEFFTGKFTNYLIDQNRVPVFIGQ